MPTVPAQLPIYPVNDQSINLELQSKGAVACSPVMKSQSPFDAAVLSWLGPSCSVLWQILFPVAERLSSPRIAAPSVRARHWFR